LIAESTGAPWRRRLAFDFKNEHGRSLRISGGPWSVYLGLASAFGWKAAGTILDGDPSWKGRYDSSDGQTVAGTDAYELCRYLVGAVKHPQFDFAVSDTISRIEAEVEASGIKIPSEMRIQSQVIKDGINDLCIFLTEGSFQIT
jgi:hypothetical protein